MKTLCTLLVLVLSASSLGAVIRLGDVWAFGPATVAMPVTVSADGGFNGVTVYVGWYEDLTVDFEYDANWLSAVGQVGAGSTPISYDNGAGAYASGNDMFAHDVSFGGTRATNIVNDDTEILVGRVLITIPPDMPPGDYRVYVDAQDSALSSGDRSLTADYVAYLRVAGPEPVSLALLAIGCMMVVRRRHG